MSVNTAHADNGVLIHSGESIILFSDNVNVDFSGQDGALFKGTKNGKIYLTTHRMIFNNNKQSDPMRSFSFPFVCLTDVEIEQPVFGANFIRGKVRAQENGQFTGEAKFKLLFKSGGAIDFAQCALQAAFIAKKYGNQAAPPPYYPPAGGWHQAPPPAYSASPAGYYGWVPNTQAFPNGPPPNSVYMSDNPPPYPGIVPMGGQTPNGYSGGPPNYNPGYGGQSGYPGAPQGYPGAPQGYPGAPQGYPGAPQGYPGAPQGYPGAPQGYPGAPQGYPGAPPAGYPGGAPQGGNPGWNGPQPGAGGFAPPPTMYPQMPGGGGGYPGAPGTLQSSGAMGFSGPANGKEAEAAQSAYNPNPNQPQKPDAPPPDYFDEPPTYNSLSNKKKM